LFNKSKYFEDIINFLEFDEDLINILEDIKYDININKKFNREENIDAFVDYVIDGQSESDYFEYLSRRKCLNYLYKYDFIFNDVGFFSFSVKIKKKSTISFGR
jgi:hypothetical protein